MKGRIKKIGLLIIISLLLQILLAINANSLQIKKDTSEDSIITVDINGNGDFKSIQKAIDAARKDDTIYIKQGEYPEILTINKKIILQGENKNKTIINPTSDKNKYAINIKTSNVNINDLSIENKGPGLYTSGIRISKDKNTINNCNFYDTPVGIIVWTSNNKIKNCTFWNCEDEGIALIGSSYSECKNNEIKNCIFYDNCDGIELQFSSNNVISDCSFYRNTHTGIDAIAKSNNNNIIRNCKIYENQVHGIYFADSDDNQIIDCEVFDNFVDDVYFNKNSKNNVLTQTDTQKNNLFDNDAQTLKKLIVNYLLDKLSIFRSSGFIQRFKATNL